MSLPRPSAPDSPRSSPASPDLSSTLWRVPSWRLALLAAVATLVAAVVLAEAYRATTSLGGQGGWRAAALLNSLLAALVLAFAARRQGGWARLFALVPARHAAPAWLAKRPSLVYLPAVVVLGGAGLLAASGRLWGGAKAFDFDPLAQAAFILWIPLIEELVFRVGFGGLYRRWVGGAVGMWFAALLFALAHTAPSVGDVLQGSVALPLGPFLLGIACEILIAWTGSVLPSVALHAACNATVVVFSLGDARFLEWFGALYS